MVGRRIQCVRYYTIDYRRWELHPELVDTGPRHVIGPERDVPTWQFAGFDAVDYGCEIVTDDNLVFSVTWETPGEREGILIALVPMLGSGVRPDADVAIWDVTDNARPWVGLAGAEITAVNLRYQPWDGRESTYWCPGLSIRTSAGNREVILGDHDGGILVPSADNIAVLHPGTPLPDWAR